MFKQIIFRVLSLAFILMFLSTFPGLAQTNSPKKKQFTYVLKIAPDYQKESAWTPTVQATVGKHFNYLKDLTAKGTVILAGRTDYNVENPEMFGIIIMETETQEEATKFMQNDPAVQGKIMLASLHPFSVVLQRK